MGGEEVDQVRIIGQVDPNGLAIAGGDPGARAIGTDAHARNRLRLHSLHKLTVAPGVTGLGLLSPTNPARDALAKAIVARRLHENVNPVVGQQLDQIGTVGQGNQDGLALSGGRKSTGAIGTEPHSVNVVRSHCPLKSAVVPELVSRGLLSPADRAQRDQDGRWQGPESRFFPPLVHGAS